MEEIWHGSVMSKSLITSLQTHSRSKEREKGVGFELSECRVFYYNSKKFEKANYKKKKKKHLSYGRGNKVVS